MRRSLIGLAVMLLACDTDLQHEVEDYLSRYDARMQGLYYESQEAEWASNTYIVEGDTTNAARTRRANEALAAFVGSAENIERIQHFVERGRRLTPLEVRQLEAMLYTAANQPGTVPELVAQRIAAETKQVETLFGFEYTLDGQPITPNQIDDLLRSSDDLDRRLAVWEASKEVGPALKTGIVELRRLRNATVRALAYPDYFAYQVSEYGMTADEMLDLNERLVHQLRPLYRELHTWARYTLAERYGQPVPDMIPAHWLPNRWAQDWTALVEVEGLDLDAALAEKSAEWIMEQGEAFYVSLGFDTLPTSFWERSSLYPLPAGADHKKNTHASAWHMDLDKDVRSLMSVEPNAYWWETVLHELGHVYYFMSYSRPEVPPVLREGANRAYHEGVGSLIGLASMQRAFLVDRGLAPADAEVDRIGQLLHEALNYVVFIPWSAGVMTQFEHDLYAGELPPDQFNARWWQLVREYQGVVPPVPRGEEYADALTKTHINDDAAQYYDYALANALLFQLHDHIARNILGQDPYDTNYWGSREVGDFLYQLMAPGASRPWREVLQETTGRELDAQAMVEYFQPLYEWLVEQNRGRQHTLD
ncbi:MAG TPA: M2 family metallopeptidase [Gemmatimonadota bacterium]|nr:M2 family metallopeptidase [Gemmatimonadota bacterium]